MLNTHPTAKGSPFTVGGARPSGEFVHVLDEATFELVIGELDTITEFRDYLLAKERGRGMRGEVVKDVATCGFLAVSIGPAASGKDVVALLERLRIERGGLPLVLITDNGPAYRSRELEVYLRPMGVVHLFSLTRTPQHNSCAERGMREIEIADGPWISRKRAWR